MNPSRHFVHIDGRIVHYRRWGQGPAVIAVHGSPQSSRALTSQAAAFAARGLCVIAPDTPGNGLSAPLGGEPSSGDYARALAGFADALGLGRIGVYGFHTGAATACALAALQPQRVTAAVFEGLPAWTEAERADILAHYLTPFTPSWDGAHMAWLWARLEEQTVFFPWHNPTPAARMDYDVPPLAALHANAIDFLDAGDAYRAPYASAFAFRPEAWLGRITAPTILAAMAGDPLSAHTRRPPLDGLSSTIFALQPSLVAAAADHLAAHPGEAAPPPPVAGSDSRGLTQAFADSGGARLAWRGRPEGDGRALVLLHGAGESSGVWDAVLGAIAAQRPVIAFDLPGHGASGDDWRQAPDTLQRLTEAIEGASQALGLRDYAVTGQGLGGLIATDLARRGQASAAAHLAPAPAKLDGEDLEEFVTQSAPSLAPEWDGAHLLRAFRIARWQRLFSPWRRRDRAHAVVQRELAPATVHARAVDLLKAAHHWTAAVRAEVGAGLAPGAAALMAVDDDPRVNAERLAGLHRT